MDQLPQAASIMTDTLSEPFVLADHPVLDMLNTQAIVEGQVTDFWRSDADVLAWLQRLGLHQGPLPRLARGVLLDTARRLREAVRVLVEQRKAGGWGDPAELNGFLQQAASHAQLVWSKHDGPRLQRVAEHRSAEQLLAPLAEQAGELIATGDFTLVRQCEHSECILWFYDRTKSHRRRWCSMALCGNRHKVAEHRKRLREL
ncbi:CGNR zinc finger domain-containing protein [Pseudomonas sp. BJa5]|uniref:CGNR zinc finger domain-containing protein n=1 Tax=Pseudomonas sp. BJa5 TaxID=2936270 RepID=UPI0025598158|nr:ABATE domain-containing protein [Pseudomonas sp. BGr12]MDL2421661.1 CGNR zinc finger domain-containing protein [Pseudomonas sp. BGr12]